MKYLFAALLLTTSALADTPAAISADYREKAAVALAKVNGMLEKATVPLVAALIKAGDTAGAEELQAQLKAKTVGEPVAKPQSSAIALFKSYDAARTKAMEPTQKATVARIDSMLASSEGKKLEVVAELGKVRAEINGGIVSPAVPTMPMVWDYFTGSDRLKKQAEMIFKPNGTVSIVSKDRTNVGKWALTKDPNVVKVTLEAIPEEEKCEFRIVGNDAELVRPIGTRYLRVKP